MSINDAPAHGTLQTWGAALARPTVETYAHIAADPKASATRGFVWYAIASLAAAVISAVGWALFDGLGSLIAPRSAEQPSILLSLGLLLLCSPLLAVVSVATLGLNAGLSHLVAGLLGGSGSYGKLVYVWAAYLTPFTIIASALGAVPIVGLCLVLPLMVYGIVLSVTALKAVYGLSWGRAFAASVGVSVAVGAALMVVTAVLVIVVLALLGPAIGEVFSEIIREIEAP